MNNGKSHIKEALINSTNEMKCEVHGTQRPGPINKIGAEMSYPRSDSLARPINQCFLGT